MKSDYDKKTYFTRIDATLRRHWTAKIWSTKSILALHFRHFSL